MSYAESENGRKVFYESDLERYFDDIHHRDEGYNVSVIINEVSYFDPETGDYYWEDLTTDEIIDICEAHHWVAKFDYWELDAYLGDFVDDYDVDAIIDEVTEIDYRTGNRYWKDLTDEELWAICEAHDLSSINQEA